MKIAAVLHEDRHTDPSLFLFEDPEAAVAFAKVRARAFDRWHELDEALTPAMVAAGWLYSARIGEEGGTLRVEVLDVAAAGHPAAVCSGPSGALEVGA